MRPYVDLFFMGAAFLLLETKSVVQFALLFGTTWFVNSLVFAGILLAVLAAIEVARRAKPPRPIVMYGALLACLAVAWLIPPASLLSLSTVPRFFASVLVAFAPVFVANLIFADRFRDVGASTIAFGANLLGGDARWGAGVPRDRHGLPRVAVRGRDPLRLGLRHGPPASGIAGAVGARGSRRRRRSVTAAATNATTIPIHTTAPAIRPLVTASSS